MTQEETLVLKLISFWAIVNIVLYVIAKIKYYLSGSIMIWKYWKDEDFIGGFQGALFFLGMCVIVIYLFVSFGIWFFH